MFFYFFFCPSFVCFDLLSERSQLICVFVFFCLFCFLCWKCIWILEQFWPIHKETENIETTLCLFHVHLVFCLHTCSMDHHHWEETSRGTLHWSNHHDFNLCLVGSPSSVNRNLKGYLYRSSHRYFTLHLVDASQSVTTKVKGNFFLTQLSSFQPMLGWCKIIIMITIIIFLINNFIQRYSISSVRLTAMYIEINTSNPTHTHMHTHIYTHNTWRTHSHKHMYTHRHMCMHTGQCTTVLLAVNFVWLQWEVCTDIFKKKEGVCLCDEKCLL